MTERKKKLSKLCLAGFIMSVLSPGLLVLAYFTEDINPTIFWTAIPVILLFQLSGIVLSIVGLVTACKKGRKGKGIVLMNGQKMILWRTLPIQTTDLQRSGTVSYGNLWLPQLISLTSIRILQTNS